MTEHLKVFESGRFQLFGDGEPGWPPKCLYVGFVRDAVDDPKRWPAVTALFTVFTRSNDGTDWYFLEWLETSMYTGETEPLDGQVIRDEFMGVLEELHPGFVAEPEAQEEDDGSVYYIDTLDGLEEEDFRGSIAAAGEK
jgi:hypothetical protein